MSKKHKGKGREKGNGKAPLEGIQEDEQEADTSIEGEGAVIDGMPLWDEDSPLMIGNVFGERNVTINPPLNEAAVKDLNPAAAIAIALHKRVERLEKVIQRQEKVFVQNISNLTDQLAKLKKRLNDEKEE